MLTVVYLSSKSFIHTYIHIYPGKTFSIAPQEMNIALCPKYTQNHLKIKYQKYTLFPRGKDGGRNSQVVWDCHVHTAIFKMDNQQGPTVQHREHCSMLCGSLDGRGVWWRMDTCIRMAESLCYPPETITTLLIGYTPI